MRMRVWAMFDEKSSLFFLKRVLSHEISIEETFVKL